MLNGPFGNQSSSTFGKFTFYIFQRPNVDQRLIIAINRVKVRWRVIIIKHSDDNSVKAADFWH